MTEFPAATSPGLGKHLQRKALVVLAFALVGLLGLPVNAARANTPTPIPADAHWLTAVNYFRAMVGQSPVRENSTWSEEARLHSCYMLYNGISHDETPGLFGYTPQGRTAGLSSNVAVSAAVNPPARRFVELWMTAPFHAIGLMRHNWVEAGYGQCDLADTTPFKSAGTLDVIRGLRSGIPRPSTPILFPGNGTTTNLFRFIAETPNPLDFCGWTGQAGLPVIALMPETFAWSNSSMTGPAGPIQTCTLDRNNTNGVAQSVLSGDNGVVVMPRVHLEPGTYSVTVNTSARSVTWSFTVDPAVADAPLTPAPNTTVTGPQSGFVPLAPARLVDTRARQGGTRLRANTPLVIEVAGRAGVPGDATAVNANFTAVGGSAAGYLTLYPCGGAVPLVSTLNFGPGEIVPNAAIVPLDVSGRMCAVSNTSVDLLVDVNGAYSPSAPGRMSFVAPVRFFDTRNGHRTWGRLPDGGELNVRLRGAGTGVPDNATAVLLNVTGSRSWGPTFVTVYAADQARPWASNLNLRAGETRANLVLVPLSADGRAKFYTERAADLFADLIGYVTNDGVGAKFSPLEPTRFTDTRDARQTLLNAGTNGNPVAGGQAIQIPMRGTRGVPQDAKAVAVNVTTTSASAGGFVAAYPCTASVPFISTVNLQPGVVVPNAAAVQLSAGGSICVYASHSTHVVVDVTGYWG